MEKFEDYNCYTKKEALELLPTFSQFIGVDFYNPRNKRTYTAKYIILLPADPVKQHELKLMLMTYSAGKIPYSEIELFESLYLLDEYIIGAYSISEEEPLPSLFDVLPVRNFVDKRGRLVDGFAFGE